MRNGKIKDLILANLLQKTQEILVENCGIQDTCHDIKGSGPSVSNEIVKEKVRTYRIF